MSMVRVTNYELKRGFWKSFIDPLRWTKNLLHNLKLLMQWPADLDVKLPCIRIRKL